MPERLTVENALTTQDGLAISLVVGRGIALLRRTKAGVPAQNPYQHGRAGTLDGAVAGAKNEVVMAQATKLGFCGSCRSEVPAARNRHRVRNTTAANFAAANPLALASSDFTAFGATGPYVCPCCGGEVKVSRKGGRRVYPGARPGRP
jgi:hypothetical protein